MKKFLSLVLALVMTVSLVTVSAGAKDFTDDSDILYDEAVSVISAVKVVDGYSDGSFNPKGTLTRGAAAKIICNLILGPTTAAELSADTAPYKDVPVNHTFAGYIAFCQKEGIISGYADGSFRPAASLTSYAFMKMLLGALGYDSEIEGFTGSNWSINVAKQALNIGLNASLDGDFVGQKFVTREEACLYAFNTLKATMVSYDAKTTVNVNGASVVVSASDAKPVKWAEGITHDGNVKDDDFVQFAEQYFTKLVKQDLEDSFGRPAREWKFEGKEIGTFLNKDLLVEEYTAKVTGRELYDLLGKQVLTDYDLYTYIDGVDDYNFFAENIQKLFTDYTDISAINKNNKSGVGATGNGVLTQVFVDSDKEEVTIAIMNTYLAIANGDYNAKKDEVKFDVYGVAKKTVKSVTELVKDTTNDPAKDTDVKSVSLTIEGEDFAIAEDVKDGEAYLVKVAEGEIQEIVKAESIAKTKISSFKTGSNVTAGGEKYSYADAAVYKDGVLDVYTKSGTINLKDTTYNIYLDEYGYLIGVEIVEKPTNYLFVTGIEGKHSNFANATYDAKAIMLDGTMKDIKVKAADGYKDPDGKNFATMVNDNGATINSWHTYTVNKDGVYTIELVKYIGKTADMNGEDVGQHHMEAPKGGDAAVKAGNKEYAIDNKNIDLPGTYAETGAYSAVYGDDESIYITASVKKIAAKAPAMAVIIDEVDAVSTGIKNTNLLVWDQATVMNKLDVGSMTGVASRGVYTLFNDDGDVIAAIVIGQDSAASKNLVFTHTGDVELESYDEEAAEWTWTRKVVLNGEEVTLTEKGDELSLLENMSVNSWYQVKYNAEGDVIGVYDADKAGTYDQWDLSGNEYVTDIADVKQAAKDNDTVLFFDNLVESKLTATKHTLYLNTELTHGMRVADDVKIVLKQTNDNKETTSFEEGYKALEDILDDLNEDEDEKVSYRISAIIEDGEAVVVTIVDGVKHGTSGNTPTAPVGKLTNAVLTAETGSKTKTLGVKYDVSGADYDKKKVVVTYFEVVGNDAFEVQVNDKTTASEGTNTVGSTYELTHTGYYFALIEVMDGAEVVASIETPVKGFSI